MKKLFLFLLQVAVVPALAQDMQLTVKAGKYERHNTLVTYHPEKQLPAGKVWQLEEIKGSIRVPVAVQQDAAGNCIWMMEGHMAAGAERTYHLYAGPFVNSAALQALVSDSAILLEEGKTRVLQYNTAVVSPPAGSDTVYKRSGFIHPLWAPNGVVLTNIFPNAGHRHHMGIWNPWTHTMFEGKETDFWNVQKKEGKLRYGGLVAVAGGNVYCGFKVKQEHVAFPEQGREKIAIAEVMSVRAYRAYLGGSRRIWDMESEFECPGDSGILLMQYRYGGGFGLRTTPYFTDKTSKVLTSEGKTRKDADSTRARWVMITGDAPQGRAGLLIMSSGENYDSPEALRVWPENMEGGELMLNYSPTKIKSWRWIHGNVYTLKYRILVYSGDLSVSEAELAWLDYAYPPEVIVSSR
ncbi:methane monooxygenase PmoA-like [Chitinophaga dinghuensis]|uniref:Methane monooxygenase PmoA-like n=1 Tax=Chitinophaga dinghuensis TaxID=1539050 RepID=A0A327W671_9BACT|nr:PmoA family protein [Chitinophaga dinghuensis]RAJ83514.1 methane monooxygenase PmoA-like [Chitinophaga dinghuensis]